MISRLARSGFISLEQEPQAGITLYAAACVLALAAELSKGPGVAKQLEDQALSLLQKTLAQGYGHDSAATDPDLRALRHRPEFSIARRPET